MGTLKAQLAQHGMSERIDEVLAETPEVRRELGYPGMATPLSQLVGSLAVLNVVTGKRFSVISDEVIQYAAGHYGQPVAPIEPERLDRIMSSPHAREVAGSLPEQPSAEDLRRRYGTKNNDELILCALVRGPAIEKMRAAGPVRPDFPLLSSPELAQVRKLLAVANLLVMQVRSQAMTLTLRRNG